MSEGFIKIHRKIMESSVWKNTDIIAVWLWCLLRANHKDTKVPFNGDDIELKSGEFITGRNKATEELPISPQTYRTCIKYLKSTSRITIKSTNRFSIISIVKWEEYQTNLTSKSTNKLTNSQPATNQPLTTDKNDKNVKNDKNICIATQGVADDLNHLIGLFKGVNPSYTRLYSNTTQRSALERLVNKIGYDKVKGAISILERTNEERYAPVITTPLQLEEKLGNLISFVKKEKTKNIKNKIISI